MIESEQKPTHPRIISTLGISAAIAFVLAIFVLLIPFQRKIEELAIRSQGEVSQHAATSIQLALSTLIQREWESLIGYSTFVNMSSLDAMRNMTNAATLASEGLEWAGIVGLDGKILAGTDGIDEGRDVSKEHWFIQGARRDSVQTIADYTAGEDAIYFSRPIRNLYNQVTAVAVYRMRGAWLDQFLANTSQRLDVDISVLDDQGRVFFSHGDRVANKITPLIQSRAELGTQFESIFTEGEEQAHVAGVLPNAVEGRMPDFGWSLVVALPVVNGSSALGIAINSMMWSILGVFLAIALLAAIFAIRYLKPITDLAREAKKIADGEMVYPTEATRSYEAEMFATALTRLQVRMNELPKDAA